MRPALLLTALLFPLASAAGDSQSAARDGSPHARRSIVLRISELYGPGAPVQEVFVGSWVSTIITTPWALSARGTGIAGGESFVEVLLGDQRLVVTPRRPLVPGERFPLIIRLRDQTVIPVVLVAAVGAPLVPDGEVAISIANDEEAELRVQLAAVKEQAQGLAARLRQALQEQDSEDFALAGLLAGGYLKLTALEVVRERLLVTDERGEIAMVTCAARHGARKVAVLLTVTNNTAAPMQLLPRGLYNRVTLARVPFAARASEEIAPGARGRLAIVLDGVGLPSEDALSLELQVRRGDARTDLPVDLAPSDFGSRWPF